MFDFFFKKKMADHCYLLVPVEKLCMQIINHSMHLRTISDKKRCNCQVFIFRCTFKAKKQLQDDFIDFKTTMDYFQHSSYLCILKEVTDEKKLLDNVYCFIRKKKIFS